jgi:hypothetical protein
MSSSKKIGAADRSRGGPGSSQQNRKKRPPAKARALTAGAPTNSRRSRVSGGGGERDLHRTHARPENQILKPALLARFGAFHLAPSMRSWLSRSRERQSRIGAG